MILELNSPNTLIIGVQNGNGYLLNESFQRQNPNDLEIICRDHGQELFNILFDDLGYISYYENKLALRTILLLDDESSVMKIVGKVAESIITRRCDRSLSSNRMWMNIASNGAAVPVEKAREFRAIGTGFKSTKINYPTAYNPNDKQRDIIWIDGNNMHFPIQGSSNFGARDAGLQIKASTKGMNYIYRDILNETYEVPVVYFDFSADYGIIYNRLLRELPIEKARLLRDRFISIREYDEDAYYEAEYYTAMIRAVLKKRLKVEDLIFKAEGSATFSSAIMATAMESIAQKIILEPSDDESPLPE